MKSSAVHQLDHDLQPEEDDECLLQESELCNLWCFHGIRVLNRRSWMRRNEGKSGHILVARFDT